MGKPVKIVDLAKQLIELSGFQPDVDIEIEYSGLRPGEKMFEEINYHKEKLSPTTHPKIMGFATTPQNIDDVKSFLQELSGELHGAEANTLKLLLKKAVPEYKPFLTN